MDSAEQGLTIASGDIGKESFEALNGKGYSDGKPCNHPGCLNHVSHPCEGCGRIAGMDKKEGV